MLRGGGVLREAQIAPPSVGFLPGEERSCAAGPVLSGVHATRGGRELRLGSTATAYDDLMIALRAGPVYGFWGRPGAEKTCAKAHLQAIDSHRAIW